MARSYFSTVIDRPATAVWSIVRDFGAYAWAGTGVDATIEGGRSGDAVGAARRVETPGGTLRQRLLAHSDLERSYTYELCEPTPYPIRSYVGTLRVTPVVDGGRAFVEWWATFDVDGADTDPWEAHFERAMAGWLGSLRAVCAGEAASPE
jgi:hypothetical protein